MSSRRLSLPRSVDGGLCFLAAVQPMAVMGLSCHGRLPIATKCSLPHPSMLLSERCYILYSPIERAHLVQEWSHSGSSEQEKLLAEILIILWVDRCLGCGEGFVFVLFSPSFRVE